MIYGMGNQALDRAETGSNRGLDATFAFDWSPGDVNGQNSQITPSLRYNGPIPSRPRDTVAFGFLFSNIGDPFQAIGVPLGSRLGSEEAIELNYAAHLTSYFLIQPVFQYDKDVGGNSHVPNAAVFGFRTQVNFRSRSGAL